MYPPRERSLYNFRGQCRSLRDVIELEAKAFMERLWSLGFCMT